MTKEQGENDVRMKRERRKEDNWSCEEGKKNKGEIILHTKITKRRREMRGRRK